MVGTAGSASAQAAPSKSTWLAAASAALKGDTTYIDGKKHARAETGHRAGHRQHRLGELLPALCATPPVLALEKRAVQDGYKVLLATGRSSDSGGTLKLLTKAGYHVDQLCFRDPKASSTQASKTACRAKWTAAGYGIIANIGNHTTDLAGSNSGKQYLLPNHGFLD